MNLLPFMYVSLLFPSVGAFFRRLFRIFDLFLLFFNDIDLFPYTDFLTFIYKNPRNSMT